MRAWKASQLSPPGYEPPGGESWPVFHQRVELAWARMRALAEEIEGDLAVVTHGLVCRGVVTRHVESAGHDAAQPWTNTSVTILEPAPWRAVLVNCSVHLEGVSSRDGGAA